MPTMTSATRNDQLLRRALMANTAFCALSGVIFAAASSWVGDRTGIDPTLVRVLGIGLVVYAAVLFKWSSREILRPAEAWMAIAGDVIWVVATLGLLAVFTDEFTTTGIVVTIVLALIVGDFATVQWIGLRRMTAAGSD